MRNLARTEFIFSPANLTSYSRFCVRGSISRELLNSFVTKIQMFFSSWLQITSEKIVLKTPYYSGTFRRELDGML